MNLKSLVAAVAAVLLVPFAVAVPNASASTLNPAVALSSSGFVDGQDVVATAGGGALAVWSESGGAGRSSSFARPAGWSAAPPFLDPAPWPQITAGPDGTVVASWRSSDASLYVQMRSPSGAWGAPTAVSDPGAISSSIAVGPSGVISVVWRRRDATDAYIVQGRERRADGSWGPIQDLSSSAGRDSESVERVAIGADGTTTVVWTSNTGGDYTVQSRSHAPGEPWGAITQLSASGYDAFGAEVAVSQDGTSTAVWWRNQPKGVIQARSRPAGGQWGDAANLSDPSIQSYSPKLAVSPKGDAVALWSAGDDAVRTSSRSTSGSWNPPVQLATHGFASAVGLAPSGTAIAVFSDDGVLRIAERPAGAGWSSARGVSNPAATYASGARLAVGADAAFVVWREGDGPSQIFGRTLDLAEGPSTPTEPTRPSEPSEPTNPTPPSVPGNPPSVAPPEPILPQAPAEVRPGKPSATLSTAKGKRGLTIRLTNVPHKARLTVSWKPKRGKAVRQTVTVSKNNARVVAPKKKGRYRVTVTYGGRILVKNKTVVVR